MAGVKVGLEPFREGLPAGSNSALTERAGGRHPDLRNNSAPGIVGGTATRAAECCGEGTASGRSSSN